MGNIETLNDKITKAKYAGKCFNKTGKAIKNKK
jgi:hypothetical protein